MELGERLDALADRFLDRRDALAGDPDHVLRDVDAGHPVAAAGKELAQPAGPAADVEHLGADAEAEPVDDVRERAQALAQLVAGRDAERLRPQPQLAAGPDALDVPPVGLAVVLSQARQPSALLAPP